MARAVEGRPYPGMRRIGNIGDGDGRPAAKAPAAFFRQLYVQVLMAIVAAIIFGLMAPTAAVAVKPLGDAFIALLRMMLGPIIFCAVVLGFTHVADMRQLGRLAAKALFYFEAVTTVAMLLGFAAVNLVRPGDGLHAVNLQVSDGAARAASSAGDFTAVRFFLSIIPTTVVDAFARGEILQRSAVHFGADAGAALSIGGGAARSGGAEGPRRNPGHPVPDPWFHHAPGAHRRVRRHGGGHRVDGRRHPALPGQGGDPVVGDTSFLFVVVVLGGIAAVAGLPLWRILLLVREELLLVLGTASGEVVLPRMMRKLEEAGCDQAVVGFVLPAGYSFNLDGTSIYMAICTGFIAQATDTPFPLSQQLTVLAVLMLTSKGGSTIAGGAFIKLAATSRRPCGPCRSAVFP